MAPDSTSVDWQPRTCGTGCVEVDHLWRTGTTMLHVETTGSDGGDATSMLNVEWPPVDSSGETATALTSFRATPVVHVREPGEVEQRRRLTE